MTTVVKLLELVGEKLHTVIINEAELGNKLSPDDLQSFLQAAKTVVNTASLLSEQHLGCPGGGCNCYGKISPPIMKEDSYDGTD